MCNGAYTRGEPIIWYFMLIHIQFCLCHNISRIIEEIQMMAVQEQFLDFKQKSALQMV